MKNKIPVLNRVKDFPLWAISQADTLNNKTGSWRSFRPIYRPKLPPCNHACPTNNNIQGYIDLAQRGQYREAWELIKENNPIPSICGRVCFHPCEGACNRGEYDEAVAVHNIERFIGDYGLAHNLKVKTQRLKTNRKIAIIGGGPAGLACAYHLARLGYRSTIFEANKELGGVLLTGIPPYRLPKDILKKEISSILRMGVKALTHTRIGHDKTFESLIEQYDAVFVATGAHKERKLDIPGEDNSNVMPALAFLHNINLKHKIRLGKKVAIIGGGNAAIDAARSVLRTGAEPVIIYRRTKNEMPASTDEIKDAEEEGIKFIFLAAPAKIITSGNKISQIECIRMKLGAPDKSGRRAPIPVKGSNFRLKIDTVIPAIGEETDTEFLPPNMEFDKDRIITDYWGFTSLPGVFAGGDIVTGPKTVVEALGAGKKAARAIHNYLTNKTLDIPVSESPVSYKELNSYYFEHADRVRPAKLTPPNRRRNIKEVYSVFKPAELAKETERCFSCGVCNQCDNCYVFCPDSSVLRNVVGKKTSYEFNYDYCKGCGLCVTECPRHVIALEEEKR